MIKKFLTFLILGLRPLLGPAACKFPVSCTDYAVEQLEKERITKAVWRITKRLLKCNPFT